MAQYTPSAVKPPTGTLADDGDLQSALPRICVDYLSHQWAEEDVWRSWRSMTRHKLEISNGLRLENASWRTWWKQRNKLKTVSPETLNWSVFLHLRLPPSHFLLCFLAAFFPGLGSNPTFVSWTALRELAAAWVAHDICLSSPHLASACSPSPWAWTWANGEAGASCELSPCSLAPAAKPSQKLARPNYLIPSICWPSLAPPTLIVLSVS